MTRVVFLYHNPRDQLLADVAAGRAPDTGLFGSNHLGPLGIDARVTAPRVQVKHKKGGLRHRVLWNVRELPVAWELDASVVCSFWTRLFPLVARARGRPRVIAFNIGLCTTFERASRPRQRLMTAALRSSAAVVCFAASQREQLLSQHDLDPAHVHLVPFGVDPRFYLPQPLPSDGYVLAVGRDMARDYGTFAKAMRHVDAPGVIVASERNLAGVALPDNVEVRLDVSYPELRDLYAGAACVVMPTRRQDFSFGADCSGQTVLLDSMAMGKPIVASARSTLSGYVDDAETALVVPPEDPASLAATIEKALSDRELAIRLGAAARRRVDEELSTAQMARRLAPIIRSAASSG